MTFRVTQLEQRESLSERLAAQMRMRILKGEYAPGLALPPEHAIATAFGVSRSVSREAIARLKAEGLLEGRQGVGIFVAAELPSPIFRVESSVVGNFADILKIAELRQAYEGEAARLAAVRRSKTDLEKLHASIHALDQAIESSDLKKGIEADLDFHRTISKATYNEYFLKFFESLSETLTHGIAISRENSSYHHRFHRQSFEEHSAILHAIEQSDPQAARRAAEVHIENTRKRLEATAARLRK